MKKIYLLLLLMCITIVSFGQVVHTEGFESSTFPPTGWSNVAGNSEGDTWSLQIGTGSNPSASPHGGSNSATYNAYDFCCNGDGNNGLLITPVIDWSARASAATTVTIWMYRDASIYNDASYSTEGVTAYVNTSASLTGAVSMGYVPRDVVFSTSGGVAGTSSPSSEGWYQYTFTVPTTYNSATNYIIFNGVSQYGNNIFIDDVQWTSYPPPFASTTPSSLAFGAVTTSTYSGSQSFSLTGSSLSPAAGNLTVTAPANFQVSPDGTTWYSSSYTIAYTGGTLAATNVYVRFSPSATTSYTGNVTITGGGLTAINEPVAGTGSTACTGTPTAGTATVTPASGAGVTPFTLSLSGYTVSGGITFQWQSSPDNTTWTNITGAINVTYSFTGITGSTYYRCNVTCTSSSSTAASTSSEATFLPAPSCTTTAASWTGESGSYSYGVGTFTVTAATGASLNDATIMSAVNTTTGYLNRTTSIAAVTLYQNGVYPSSMSWGSASNNQEAQVWIDFNNDGIFQTSEEVTGVVGYNTGTTPNPTTFNITIPPTANTGVHLMRMRGIWETFAAGTSLSTHLDPCLIRYAGVSPDYYSGTCVDYYVNIAIPPPLVTVTPSSLSFPATTTGTSSAAQTFSLAGSYLVPASGNLTVTAPANFEVSPDGTTWYSSSYTIAYTGSATGATPVYVRFDPAAGIAYTGNVTITGGGLTATVNVPVTGTGAAICSGTPTAGTASISPAAGGVADVFSLSVTGYTVAGGITFQWQSSPDNSTWSNISGATLTNYSFSGLTTNTYYRCNVICTASSSSVATPSVEAIFFSPSSCTPSFASASFACSYGYGAVASSSYPLMLTGASGAINDGSACNGTGYSDFTSSTSASLTCTLNAATTYTVTVGANIYGATLSDQIWIDFNNNGTFESSESVGGTASYYSATNATAITIPSGSASITPGVYRMRVENTYAAFYNSYPSLPPCPTSSTEYYGEVRDYKITLAVPPIYTLTPTSIAFSPTSTGSTSATTNVSFSGAFLTPASGSFTVTAPSGFYVYNGTAWVSSYTIPYSGSTLSTVTIPVQFAPTVTTTYSGNVTISGGGIGTVNVAVNGTGATPCSGTPVAGVAYVTPTSGNATTVFTLTDTAYTVAGGVGFQWQSSADTATWTNIAGATLSSYSFTGITANTYYRCQVTCSNSSITTNTYSTKAIFLPTPSCTPTASSWTSEGSYSYGVSSFSVTGFSGSSMSDGSIMSSVNTTTGYLDRTTSITAINLQQSGVYASSASWGSSSNNQELQVWIDFNNNGTFETSEEVTPVSGYNTSSTPNPTTFNISIPLTAPTGLHLMRIRGIWETFAAGISLSSHLDPCLIRYAGAAPDYYSGTCVDYYANIVALPPCSGTPAATATTASVTTGCAAYTSNLAVTGLSGVSGLTYQWQSSTDSATWTNISGATNLTYTASVTATAYYRAYVTCSASSLSAGSPGVHLILNTPPTAITGTGVFCSGLTTTLADATAGGTWASSNTSLATVGSSTGIVTGVGSGQVVISYILPTSCSATTIVTVNPAPTAPVVTPSSSSICFNNSTSFTAVSTGPQVTILDQNFNSSLTGATGGTWTVNNTGASSSYNWSIVSPSTWTDVSISGDGSNYAGTNADAAGSSTHLVTYLMSPVFSTVGYTSATLSFNYYCYSSSTYDANVEIDYSIDGGTTWTSLYSYLNTISGSTSWSASTPNQTITLPAAAIGQANVQMRWYYNSTWGFYWALDNVLLRGATVPAYTWSGISGATGLSCTSCASTTVTPTALGTNVYSVTATAVGCSTSTGVTITVNPLPAIFTVTGGGSYCSGGTGVAIGLSGSVAGVNYQLYQGSTAVGATVPGSGAAISFGLKTTAGGYTVLATNATTGCTNNMTGGATITINPLPTIYPVTGGGGYCAGGTGAHVGLLYANSGINYQLYNGSSAVGSAIGGANAALDFGLQTAAGTYTVLATDATTGCTNNMSGTTTVSINPLPIANNMTGGGEYCSGGTGVAIGLDGSSSGINYQLYNSSAATGSAVSGTGGPIGFGLQTAAGTYTVLATDATTGCTAGMTGSKNVVVDPLPVAITVTGGGSYCAGGTGVTVGLDSSEINVSYQLYNGATAVGPSVVGTGAAINFGLQTAAGTYSVVATNTITNCTANMTGTVPVTINSLPAAYTVTGDGGSYCAGGAGVAVGLSNSAIGISYQLYDGATAIGSAVSGTGLAISFGMQTTATTYIVVATNTATGCTNNMTGSATITINPLPVAYTVSGGGSYCAGGAGVDVQQDVTDPGVNYQLYNGATPVGSLVAGTGLGIDYGLQTVAGTYSVVATDAVTGCTSNMMGTAPVMVSTLPVVYNVTGGGGYCAGGAGVDIALSNSDAGISYQLSNGTTPVGSALPGTGAPLDFGNQTTEGSYTIIASDGTSGCSSNMSGGAIVNINPLPAAYYVTGGGSYCAGGTGVHVGLSASNSGINYQLYNGSTATGTAMGGTGLDVDFGLETAAGTYTVQATDATTGCTNNMTGSTMVSINPLPSAYNVTGGGTYCASGSGVHVGLDNSATGINYRLYYGSAVSGSTVAGTGSALDFGLLTGAGTYTVQATDASTGCTYGMNGNATINVNSLPSAYNVTGGGNYCAEGAGVDVALANSDTGISYQLYNGSTAASLAIAGTGSALDFGNQTAAGTYTVLATNNSTGCSGSMSGAAIVIVNAQPLVYGVTGGGNYCAGGTGTHIGLTGSDTGVWYQLYDGTTAVGSLVAGTGTALDFGLQTATGTYTVTANPDSSCTAIMTGSAIINTNALPTVDTVIGGGSYCAGGTGVHIGLNTSTTGVNYQLYDGSTAISATGVGSLVSGTGAALDFGLQTAAGTYTVLATDATTTCQNVMTGSAIVAINALLVPAVTVMPSASIVCIGTLTSFTAASTNGGTAPEYQWSINGAIVGGDSASYSYVPANGDLVKAVLTSNAACASPDTASGSITMTVINNVLPVATITATSDNICQGTVVTYTASALYGGASPAYTWVRNGIAVDSTLSYTDIPADGDIVYFVLSSSMPCVMSETVYSNNITTTVDTPYIPVVTITSKSGAAILPGVSDTLTASVLHGGYTPSYQWKLNGSDIAGATNSSYVSSTFVNNDSVTCLVTSSGACGLSSFNSVIINVNNVGVAQVSESNSDIRLLPNPNKGAFDVRGTLSNVADGEVSLEITDMLGQVVYKNKALVRGGSLNEHIQLNNTLANGMYMLNLHSDNDHKVFHFVLEQ